MPTSLDDSFLHVDPVPTMHVGSVMVFDGTAGAIDHDRLVDIIAGRLSYAPRYRQRLRSVPGGLGSPVWVTADVDLEYHVRRAALPRPGTDEQLAELVARVQARPLDPTRPLWEVYLVEGLELDRFAVITKTHPAITDGAGGLDIAQVVLDGDLDERDGGQWVPAREPHDLELLTAAVLGAVRSPARFVTALRGGLTQMAGTAGDVTRTVAGVGQALWRTATRPPTVSPLAASTGSARRYVMVGVDLDEVRAARARHEGRRGEHITVHDVILAAVTGALRTCFEARGVVLDRPDTVRALVPVGVHVDDSGSRSAVPRFVDLPVGEPAPAMRLYQVAYQTRRQRAQDRPVSAAALADVAGFTAPALHAAGARLAGAFTRRMFDLVITNVPGTQTPVTVDGHPMVSTFPVIPLLEGQALAVGVSSYDGGVFVGLHADRDAMPDAALLGAAFVEALDELAGA